MSRIRTNTLSLGTSFFVTAIFAFLQVKILTNFLDQDAVGLWSAVLAVGALLGTLSELGLPQVLVRYGAKFDAEGRLARLSALFAFSLRVFFVAALVMVGVLLLAGPYAARILGTSVVDRWLLILGYLAMASGSLRAVNNAVFRGLRRMVAMAVLEILFSTLVTVGYFLLRHRLTVDLALWVFLGASLLVAGAGGILLTALLARLRRETTAPAETGGVFREVRGFWEGVAVSGILLIAIEQLDKPLLAMLVSLSALAVFHVAARLQLFARRLLYVPFQVMFPEITHKWESPRRDELRGDMELFMKLELGLGLMLMVFLAVFARPLLLLVSTPEFLSGAPVIWIFTAVLPLLCLNQPLVLFLRAVGAIWYAVLSDALWLAIYLGLGTLFVRVFHLGLPGFVLGQPIASAIVLAYSLLVFHRLGLPRPPLGFFVKRLLLSTVVWALCVAAGRSLPPFAWWQLILLAAGLGVLGNFLLVRGGYLTRSEEERAVAMLAGRGTMGRAAGFLFAWPRRGLGGARAGR